MKLSVWIHSQNIKCCNRFVFCSISQFITKRIYIKIYYAVYDYCIQMFFPRKALMLVEAVHKRLPQYPKVCCSADSPAQPLRSRLTCNFICRSRAFNGPLTVRHARGLIAPPPSVSPRWGTPWLSEGTCRSIVVVFHIDCGSPFTLSCLQPSDHFIIPHESLATMATKMARAGAKH